MIVESGAGPLRERLSFQKRALVDDGFGNTLSGEFVEQFKIAARLQPLRRGSSETVLASRLQGVQIYIGTIRNSTQAAEITADWRCVNVRSGAVFAILTVSRREERDYIDLDLTTGTAA